MPNNAKNIRLSPYSLKIISDVSYGEQMGVSGAVNSIITRYDMFVKQCLPKLTDLEKNIVLQAYKDKQVDDVLSVCEAMPAHLKNILNDIIADKSSSGDKSVNAHHCLLSADLKLCIERAEQWSMAERLALLHYVKSYWNNQ